jgi:response regulator of citrate/malate metabolism
VIRTLIVEDDALVAEVNRGYLERIPGFSVVGVARTGADAIAHVSREPVDLLLLDFFLPDMSGLDVCRAVRALHPGGRAAAGPGRPRPVDIIAVTAARDAETVRAAVAHGVVQYLIKPYNFATLREKLERYAAYHQRLTSAQVTDQQEIDRVLETLRGSSTSSLPKGLSAATYELVAGALRAAPEALSATEVAELTGLSRVSARRYLEHLARQGRAVLSPRYGGTGRPEHRYRWSAAKD